MEPLQPSSLKTILHSKRANLYYLEHCRVLVKGGRVEYVTEQGKQSSYWNIPIANTTTVLLGTGTSITQAAVRELAKAGVMLGFCGGGGTPLFSATELTVEVAWLSPQSEVMERCTDDAVAMSMTQETQDRLPWLQAISMDKRFLSSRIRGGSLLEQDRMKGP